MSLLAEINDAIFGIKAIMEIPFPNINKVLFGGERTKSIATELVMTAMTAVDSLAIEGKMKNKFDHNGVFWYIYGLENRLLQSISNMNGKIKSICFLIFCCFQYILILFALSHNFSLIKTNPCILNTYKLKHIYTYRKHICLVYCMYLYMYMKGRTCQFRKQASCSSFLHVHVDAVMFICVQFTQIPLGY